MRERWVGGWGLQQRRERRKVGSERIEEGWKRNNEPAKMEKKGAPHVFFETSKGLQKSPGIIPLAVKDVFEIIQEVINDLLDPAGQNLRIREDAQVHGANMEESDMTLFLGLMDYEKEDVSKEVSTVAEPHWNKGGQGTYIEGIKDEVVLSPAHALSLIATGEVMDSWINHTLENASLVMVISKLTDGKAAHIPYRDSKLTRLLQSSLSGHGQISLICTVTPASGNSEETHNTLKFAHRSKRVEIMASQNKILDEKSLIKKYQKEILGLKQELQTLKHGITEDPSKSVSTPEDLANLKTADPAIPIMDGAMRYLEAGQAKLQSRLEEEEQAKAALTGRIQRLTNLILVSTKNAIKTNIPQKTVYTKSHSFGEDELAHLPDKTREYVNCGDNESDGNLDPDVPVDGWANATNQTDSVKIAKKSKRRGMLGWFKSRKPELVVGVPPAATDGQSSASISPASGSTPTKNRVMTSDVKDKQKKSVKKKQDDPSVTNLCPEKGQASELTSVGAGLSHMHLTGKTIADQLDFLQEQVKLLAGEIALCTNSLKSLSAEAEQLQKLRNVITEKKLQTHQLEQRTIASLETASQMLSSSDLFQSWGKVRLNINDTYVFAMAGRQINSADTRILQEQLQIKISENAEMHDTILLMRQQLSTSSDICPIYAEKQKQSSMRNVAALDADLINREEKTKGGKDSPLDATTPTSAITKKLAEEASYAKELAAAAAVELQHLTEEVTRLSYQNAELIDELGSMKEALSGSVCCQHFSEEKETSGNGAVIDASSRKLECEQLVEYLQKELNTRYQREAMLEAALSEKEQVERDLEKRLNEAKKHEEVLESDLENIWALIENMRKSDTQTDDIKPPRNNTSNYSSVEVPVGLTSKSRFLSGGSHICRNVDRLSSAAELSASYLKEKERSEELERLISRLKACKS
ncbi:Kinesin-like protein KIN-7E chloroplastic [Bienertia sinuspersici]